MRDPGGLRLGREVTFSCPYPQLLILRNDLERAELSVGLEIIGFVDNQILAAV